MKKPYFLVLLSNSLLLVYLIEYPSRGIYDFHKSRYHCDSGFLKVVIIYHIQQTSSPHAMHVCSDERNYESRHYRHITDELLNCLYF